MDREQRTIHWHRPADIAWGTGAVLMTLLLIYLSLQPAPPTAVTPTAAEPTTAIELTAAPAATSTGVIAEAQTAVSTAPATVEIRLPELAAPAGGLVVAEGAPVVLEGTAIPGATVAIYAGEQKLGEAVADAQGRWKLELPGLEPGNYNLTVKQTTAEGQEATLPEPVAVTVGGVAQPAGTTTPEAALPEVTAPVDGLAVAQGAPVVLEGTAIPGATVAVFEGIRKLGEAVADALGRWRLELSALEPGAYNLTLRQTTAEGQETEQPEPVIVTVGGVSQPEVAAPEGGLAVEGGEPVVLEGVAVPGATVAVYDGEQKLGEAVADAQGRWKLELPGLAPGDYDLTLKQTTAEGEETTAPEPVAVAVGGAQPVETAAPEAAAPEIAVPAVVLPAGGLVVAEGAPVVLEGTAIPGATVAIYDGLNKLGEAVADALGRWKLELTGLAPGEYGLTLRQTTAEGEEVEQPEPVAVTIGGAQPPMAATPEAALPEVRLPEVTMPGAGLEMAQAAPAIIEGVAAPGAIVAIYDGLRKLGEAIADAQGNWRLELPALEPGAYSLKLRQTTADGQEIEQPKPLVITVGGVQAPEAAIPAGGLAVEAGVPVTLEGVAAPGATVAIYDGLTKLGEAVADALGRWKLELAGLEPGEYGLTLKQTTIEGEEMPASELLSVLVSAIQQPEAAQPEATQPEVVQPEVVQPEAAQPEVTQPEVVQPEVVQPEAAQPEAEQPQVGQPQVTQPAAEVTVRQGALLPLAGTGIPGAVIAVLDGDIALAETEVGEDGAWQLDLRLPEAGEYALTIRQTTADGEEMEAAAKLVVVAAESPEVALTADEPVALRPGAEVTGVAPPGMEVQVFAGTTPVGRTTAGPDGTWRLTLPLDLTQSAKSLQFKVVDADGVVISDGVAMVRVTPPVTLPATGGPATGGQIPLRTYRSGR